MKSSLTISIDVDSDPTRPIRDLQPDAVRRRSLLMEGVRAVYARTRRDVLLEDAYSELLEDLAERRSAGAPYASTNRGEGNILVVLGASGAGKTTAVRRMIDGHALSNGYSVNAPGSKVITLTAPSPCNLAELGRETLNALGYPLVRARIDGPEVWRLVRERIRSLQVLVMHFDEMQHVVQTVHEAEMQKVRNILKGLLVDDKHPVGLVISGTPEIKRLMHPDRQIARRGRWIELAPLSTGADGKLVNSFVKQLAERAELQTDKAELDRLVPRLIHAGQQQLGVVAEEIHDAIRVALRRNGNHLGIEHFGAAFANRTGNLSPWNPYLAEHWGDIDSARVLATREEYNGGDDAREKRKGRSK
jgi:type II secretory pathway predicted ATPase ExeA